MERVYDACNEPHTESGDRESVSGFSWCSDAQLGHLSVYKIDIRWFVVCMCQHSNYFMNTVLAYKV